jgi:CRISPR-associated protein Cmr3
MKVKIRALDTLTFGVGKPAVWGEDSFGAGIFPPFPSVVRGAVRAAWLHENGSFDLADTEGDPTRDYAVTEYALLLNDAPYFPAPADFVWNEDSKTLMQCELRENDGLSSLTTPYQLWANADGKMTTAEKRYISLKDLQAYLNGERVAESVPLTDYVTSESKIGIFRGRDTNTVREGMLYRSPLTRLKGEKRNDDGFYTAALAASVNGAETDGLIRFGGENKTASFAAYAGAISPSGAIGDDGKFKLYLATPAIFKGGHLPELPVKARLLTAAVYGYDSVGGFDMKAKRPKPMRRAVKAGSVYFYELAENTPENRAAAAHALHGASISDYSYSDGFGICYIGKTEKEG